MAKQLAPQHGGDIVDILTKTNASLQPASTSRISSLYVFDAIARAAKSDAALLGKMEASVGGFVDSIIDNGKGGVWSEGRVSSSTATVRVACLARQAVRKLTTRTRRARLWTSGASRRRSRTRASRTCRARLLVETTGDQMVRYPSPSSLITLYTRCSSPRRL